MQVQANSGTMTAIVTRKPTAAVVEAWAGLVRTQRTLLDKVWDEAWRTLKPGGHFFVLQHEAALRRAVGQALAELATTPRTP